jgi:hypothetical protein
MTDTSQPDESGTRARLEARMIRLNRCFVEQILPGVFEVENDLNRAGYWNELKIGQSTSLSSGKPNIKEVSFRFFPEKSRNLSYRPDAGERVYGADIRADPDFRKVNFSIRFPQRLSRLAEIESITLKVEEIDKAAVDDFLERFVKGAIEAYSSDQLLR